MIKFQQKGDYGIFSNSCYNPCAYSKNNRSSLKKEHHAIMAKCSTAIILD